MKSTGITLLAMGLLGGLAAAPQSRPPVIDIHTHMAAERGVEIMDRLNIRLALVAGGASGLERWAKLDAMRSHYLPGITFPCPGGLDVINGRTPCYGGQEFPDIDWLRREITEGRVKALAEILPEFLGISPADPRMEPYWALAEELDIPAAIHMGPGPPGAAYDSSPVPARHPNFRMAAGDPMLLEEVLLRHKRLRLSVMHAGWPRLESMLALLYAHPNVYVDTGGLHSDRIVPRAAYYRYLQGLVENGFGKRVMFGSDFPDQIEAGIQAILDAPVLDADQKADILCGNAARFLRLPPETCQSS
ncbi:MAG: amidohydrolase family protein [Vicinamibacterales bacterium]